MIGAIIGDIAGSVYEFGGIKTKDFPLFGDYRGEKCRFTDDSAMTLAAAGALLEADEKGDDLSACAVRWMQMVGRRCPNAGYGGTFIRWLFAEEPKPYHSYGNGAAMRVSPAAWAAGSLEEALRNADAITAVTHDHPEGIKGGRAVAACVYLARTGADKETIRDHVRRNYYPLKETLAEIRPHYRFDVTCQGSVPQAIQAFLEAESFEDAIRGAISLGGDSDTQAAIAGSIAGPFFGIPEALRVKALAYLPEVLKEILFAFEARFGANKPAD
jgi:type I restriction enzyme M protein